MNLTPDQLSDLAHMLRIFADNIENYTRDESGKRHSITIITTPSNIWSAIADLEDLANSLTQATSQEST